VARQTAAPSRRPREPPAWSIPSVALAGGTNLIDIKATDTANNTFIKTLTVVQDGTPPTVTISTPAVQSVLYDESDRGPSAGTASDNNVVSLVEWRFVPGSFSPASGTTAWSVASVPMSAGSNFLQDPRHGRRRQYGHGQHHHHPGQHASRGNDHHQRRRGYRHQLDADRAAGSSSDDTLVSIVQWSNNGGPFQLGDRDDGLDGVHPPGLRSNSIVVRVTDAAATRARTRST